MSISVICFTCGHQNNFAEKLAGKVMRCQRCGAIVTVAGAVVEGADGPGAPGETLAEAAAAESQTAAPRRAAGDVPRVSRRGYGSATRTQRAAGRNCLVLSVLIYLTSMALGLAWAGTMLGQAPPIPGIPAQVREVFGAVVLGAAITAFLMATVYLICGIQIRRKGHISNIIALILTCLIEVVCLAALAGGVAAQLEGRFGENPQVGYAVIGAAALIVIIVSIVLYSLISALRDHG